MVNHQKWVVKASLEPMVDREIVLAAVMQDGLR